MACLGMGIFLLVEKDFHLAYGGGTVRGWGGSLCFCFVAAAVLVYFGLYGTYRHNKFALGVALLSDLFLLAIMMFTAVAIFATVAPTHDPDAVSNCFARPTLGDRGQLLDSACFCRCAVPTAPHPPAPLHLLFSHPSPVVQPTGGA